MDPEQFLSEEQMRLVIVASTTEQRRLIAHCCFAIRVSSTLWMNLQSTPFPQPPATRPQILCAGFLETN